MGLPEREPPRGNAAENRCGRRPRPRRLHLRLVFLRRSPDAGQQIPQLGAGRRIPESSEQRPDEILAIVVQPRSGRHRPGSRDTRDVRTADRLCDRALLQASVVLARRRMPLLLDLRGEYVPRYVRRRLRPGRRGDRPLPRKGQGSRLPRPAPQRRAVRSGRHSQSGRRRPRAQLDDFVRLDSSQHSARLSGHPLRKGREPIHEFRPQRRRIERARKRSGRHSGAVPSQHQHGMGLVSPMRQRNARRVAPSARLPVRRRDRRQYALSVQEISGRSEGVDPRQTRIGTHRRHQLVERMGRGKLP